MTALFGTALARSGGGLLSHVVSAHPAAMLARNPFLELFRSLRNAVVRGLGDPAVAVETPASAPLSDYYFTEPRLRLLEHLLATDLDVRLDPAEHARFVDAGAARCKLESPDLAPHFARIRGVTYGELLDGALELVAGVRDVADRQWVGFQEPWILEFFPALARARPDARFLVQFRDPRGVIASVKGLARTQPDQVVNAISYSRHWRKYVALVVRFLDHPLLADRLHVLRYEDLLARPAATARALCTFLGLSFDDQMLDASSYRDWGTGGTWQGNSSYETVAGTIDAAAADRWRATLDGGLHRLIDWLCGADMRLVGYEPDHDDEPAAITALVAESASYSKWRSDFGDPLLDLGCELVRRALLADGGDADERLVRRCFLVPELRTRLRQGTVLARLSVRAA